MKLLLALILSVLLSSGFGATLKKSSNIYTAKRKEFPYHVGFAVYHNEPGTSWCGGAIISDRWILTSAYCLNYTTPVGVNLYLGMLDYNDPTEPGRQQIYLESKYLITHEDFQREPLINDIALIRLPVSLQFDEYINSIQLPSLNDTNPDVYVGQKATTTGWGDDCDDKEDLNNLNYVTAPILTNEECKEKWHKDNEDGQSFFSSAYICADNSNKKIGCYTDYGSPLVIKDKKKQSTLLGLVSYGQDWTDSVPELYTRVSKYLNWIDKKMKQFS